jgi:hypothetical protein
MPEAQVGELTCLKVCLEHFEFLTFKVLDVD